MGKELKGFGILFSLTSECIVLLFIAIKGGDFLDKKFPAGAPWTLWLFLAVFLYLGLQIGRIVKVFGKK